MDTALMSKKVSAGTRVYYMDAYTDRKGQPYLSISEIPTDSNPGNKQRKRIFVHRNNLRRFAEVFNEMAAWVQALEPNVSKS